MKVLILAPYPKFQAPSQRFRFEHFLDDLNHNGIHYKFQSFISQKGWKHMYIANNFYKLGIVLAGFVRRLGLIPMAVSSDIIFVHREITPFGPPVFEWLLSRVLKKRIIYDFDDAIWMNDGHDPSGVWTWLKWRSKISQICGWSWRVSAGNDFLASFASNFCQDVRVIPTVVDTHQHKPSGGNDKGPGRVTLGWTGSHSTLFYLDQIIPVLSELRSDYEFDFVVISNSDPALNVPGYRFIKWSREREIEDLQQIDIGLMPLEDSDWARGKCGFKLIQYGAVGISSIASAVGVNTKIIDHGKTGFLVEKFDDWKKYLIALFEDPELRQKIGQNARNQTVEHYSVQSTRKCFLQLFSLPDNAPSNS